MCGQFNRYLVYLIYGYIYIIQVICMDNIHLCTYIKKYEQIKHIHTHLYIMMYVYTRAIGVYEYF